MEPRFYGHNPQGVIDALRARAEGITSQQDGRKIALIFEGGGMRGVCSAGGTVALDHLGLTNLFDHAYATSAGVTNVSYFLSGQGPLGLSVYYTDLVKKEALNPKRFWKMLDIDHVVDRIVAVEKPLHVDRVLASPTRFFAAMMDAKTAEPILIDTSETKAPFLDVIKAAISIPVLYNRTTEIEGRHCMDGGLVNPFPIEQALANGCTDILILLSREANYIAPDPGWTKRTLFNLIAARGAPNVKEAYKIHGAVSRRLREYVFGGEPIANAGGANVATFGIDEEETIHRTTADPVLLRAGATRYGRNVLRAFGASQEEAEIWEPPPLDYVES
ncbi:MAG: putative patatin/cPLA2 family phospholipase [Verrucomicrobiales bacterium]|jgi:predicted patatin/cPLA2 family phospholipase